LKKEKIYGYDYDTKQEQYISNESESKFIKTIYDLFGTYNLVYTEIDKLLFGEGTIIDVIAERIISIYNDISFYDKDYKIPINDDELENNLLDEKNIQEKTINPLLKTKKQISKFDSIIQERILKKIDDTITLIGNKNEIINKYGNFQEFKCLKNNDDKKSYFTKLNISNNKNYSGKHSPIINEVIFKKCQEVIAKKCSDKTDEKDFDIKL